MPRALANGGTIGQVFTIQIVVTSRELKEDELSSQAARLDGESPVQLLRKTDAIVAVSLTARIGNSNLRAERHTLTVSYG